MATAGVGITEARRMNFFYCWHRPGKLFTLRNFRVCRHCGVPVEECPCVNYGRSPVSDCPCCEGSGWVGLVRSRASTLRSNLAINAQSQSV